MRGCVSSCLFLGEILLEKRYDGMSAADAHLQRISDHVSAYLQIVRSQLLATVPKAVVHCTVVPAKENLLSELQEEVAGVIHCWFLCSMSGGLCLFDIIVSTCIASELTNTCLVSVPVALAADDLAAL